MDLVQLRWQQIRSLESQQATETENLSLRRSVVELKQKNETITKVHQKLLSQLNKVFGDFVRKSRNEIAEIKTLHTNELNTLRISFQLLASSTNKFKSINSGNKEAKAEIASLNEEISRLRKELDESGKSKVSEVEKLKQKLIKVKDDLEQSNHNRSLLITDYSMLKEKFETIESEKLLLNSKLEVRR